MSAWEGQQGAHLDVDPVSEGSPHFGHADTPGLTQTGRRGGCRCERASTATCNATLGRRRRALPLGHNATPQPSSHRSPVAQETDQPAAVVLDGGEIPGANNFPAQVGGRSHGRHSRSRSPT